jgi:catechol 2,3-dioxygenase-like lactoylglutathione lyase family enzyme
VDWKLELIVVPVSDIDRAKAFYRDGVGFDVNVDHSAGEDFRVVQLTPPGSACSIALMRNLEAPGSVQGLHLVVPDIEAARDELVGRSLVVSDFFHFGPEGQAAGLDPRPRELWLLLLLRRSGRQRLAGPGSRSTSSDVTVDR